MHVVAPAKLLLQQAISTPFSARTLCQGSAAGAQHVDCVVVGAGVVGLAVARALALAGREVVILDTHSTFGSETSSRNSEVIHAGLYYPPGSLKSTLCIEGKQALYEFCRQRSVPHKNTGKLVVASSQEQLTPLCTLQSRAAQCGVHDLQLLSSDEAQSLEPNLHCEAALLSPSSGILDSHTYMATLLADAESAGAVMAVASKVLKGKVVDRGSSVHTGASSSCAADRPIGSEVEQQPSFGNGTNSSENVTLDTGEEASRNDSEGSDCGATASSAHSSNAEGLAPAGISPTCPSLVRGCVQGGGGGIILQVQDMQSKQSMEVHADMVVNSAGLHAQCLSHSIDGIPSSSIPPLYLAKGNYFTLAGGTVGCGKQASTNTSMDDSHAKQTMTNNIDGTSSGQPLEVQVQPLGQQPKPLFSRLIYPMPPASGGGLGIHLTLDMGGGLRFGPDVEYTQHIDYTVDPSRVSYFEEAIRGYWPGLPQGSLISGYAGIRPKLSAPGEPAADFLVQGPKQHNVRGLVCLYGIESPGLTASLALAEHVKHLLLGSA